MPAKSYRNAFSTTGKRNKYVFIQQVFVFSRFGPQDMLKGHKISFVVVLVVVVVVFDVLLLDGGGGGVVET